MQNPHPLVNRSINEVPLFAQSCSGEPPVHRDFHSATAIGTNMYIFGGRSDLTVHGGHVGNLLPQDYYSNKVPVLPVPYLTRQMI
jgi:hypothetical protein